MALPSQTFIYFNFIYFGVSLMEYQQKRESNIILACVFDSYFKMPLTEIAKHLNLSVVTIKDYTHNFKGRMEALPEKVLDNYIINCNLIIQETKDVHWKRNNVLTDPGIDVTIPELLLALGNPDTPRAEHFVKVPGRMKRYCCQIQYNISDKNIFGYFRSQKRSESNLYVWKKDDRYMIKQGQSLVSYSEEHFPKILEETLYNFK